MRKLVLFFSLCVLPLALAAEAAPTQTDRDPWMTDFAAAQKEAAATNRRLLVLFTGTDWCAPCVEFEAQVAHAEEFLKAARPAFVLVKLDYLRNTPQAPAVQARLEGLRERYGVAVYPTLLVISADGTKSSRVDTMKRRKSSGVADSYAQAVAEARDAKQKSSFWPW